MKKQLSLFNDKLPKSFGGTLNKNKRKSKRPLSTRHPIHIVLKATDAIFLLRHKQLIASTAAKYSNKFGIKIYNLAVQSDHIHISIKIPSRDLYKKWIRTVTSILVTQISELKWILLPFTRISNWGRDLKILNSYIDKNNRIGSIILDCHLHVENWLKCNRPIESTDVCKLSVNL